MRTEYQPKLRLVFKTKKTDHMHVSVVIKYGFITIFSDL